MLAGERPSKEPARESAPAASRTQSRPRLLLSPSASTSLVDLLIERAAELVRTKSLLPSLNWKSASAEQVQRLHQRLTEAGIAWPAWLAAQVLTAGHTLPPEAMSQLPKGCRELAQINAIEAGAGVPGPLQDAILELARDGDTEGGLVLALVSRLKALGALRIACNLALAHFETSPSAVRHVQRDLAEIVQDMPTVDVRLAGFSTTRGLAEYIALALAAGGVRAAIDEAPFADALSELLAETSSASDILIIQLDFEGAFPINWRQTAAEVRAGVEERLEALVGALHARASRGTTRILINTLPAATEPTAGFIDHTFETGTAALIDRINRRLAEVSAACSGIALVDANAAMRSIAPDRRADPKLWYYGRIAYSDEATRALGVAFAGLVLAGRRGPAKVLALDFDNTLWGGIYGDDGVDRLECGDDFPGSAFKAFQQECLRLKAQGMLLVGLSKNNPDAISVFERHPGMALTTDDFAATAIDWEPKAENIRKLAASLNLGLDSVVFLDDSPHEREAMRRLCPAVHVPEMPADPARRPRWLRALVATWPTRITDEDARRAEMYASERKAEALLSSSASYEDYLRSLCQILKVEPVTARSLPRAVQLHQRTNQFNLTTRRLSEVDIALLIDDPLNAIALVGTALDKFGDHGITVAATARRDGDVGRIETFLMSCRVLKREIETAFLGELVRRLIDLGCECIEGTYRPTAKNQMVEDFYHRHGFRQIGAGERETIWQWRPSAAPLPISRNVTVTGEGK